MSTPTLRTPRLVLTPPRPEDLVESTAMWADPDVAGGTGRSPLPREQVWHRLLRHVGHWSVLGYGVFVMREAESGRFLGEVGLMDSRRESEPSFEGVPEMGWALRSDAQGQGFAREALAEVLRWADRSGIQSTAAVIAPENVRSLRLAEAVGYLSQGEVRTSGLVLHLLVRKRLDPSRSTQPNSQSDDDG